MQRQELVQRAWCKELLDGLESCRESKGKILDIKSWTMYKLDEGVEGNVDAWAKKKCWCRDEEENVVQRRGRRAGAEVHLMASWPSSKFHGCWCAGAPAPGGRCTRPVSASGAAGCRPAPLQALVHWSCTTPPPRGAAKPSLGGAAAQASPQPGPPHIRPPHNH